MVTKKTSVELTGSPEERLKKLIKAYRKLFGRKPSVSIEDGYIQVYLKGYAGGDPVMFSDGTLEDCCELFETEITSFYATNIADSIAELNEAKEQLRASVNEKLAALKDKKKAQKELLDGLNISIDVSDIDKVLEENKIKA